MFRMGLREEIGSMDIDEALVRISGHLMRANDLISVDAGGEIGGRISWAQMVMEERLGGQALEPVPSLDEAGRETTAEHLAQAAELAYEHLGVSEEDLRLKSAIHEALAAASR
jgi:hypothetical protein